MRPWRAGVCRGWRAWLSRVAAETDWSPWRDRQAWIAASLFAAQGWSTTCSSPGSPRSTARRGPAPPRAGLFTVFNAATLPAILLFPSLVGPAPPPPAASAGARHLLFLGGVLGLLTLPLADPWRWLWPALRGQRRGRCLLPWRWCCRPISRPAVAPAPRPVWCWLSATSRRRWDRSSPGSCATSPGRSTRVALAAGDRRRR